MRKKKNNNGKQDRGLPSGRLVSFEPADNE